MEQAGRGTVRARSHRATDVFGDRPSGTRHPLVALAMVLPVAAVLAVVFGGWDTVVTQASSVAGMLGR
ncbi:hypothetical protein I5Q34_21445 [Streptomyces sp. AV19]|uniref:hypothetical protein n=1 Tax=Streptomyces sp. AV19 TaxID=2793068 RepID=UPI0018FEAB68|nr:hypothetical protein [Streptomyces sp. AV19]MBH1936806.1 hypothetical protein [Streptomyces sp. AV19]MDG4532847.1 hypothetical protein [Streptomyces sp. AV19]